MKHMLFYGLLGFVLSQPLLAAEHDHHDEHEHGEHEQAELRLTPAEQREFAIQLAQAGAGMIKKQLHLTGEVRVAPERLYHVVPRVSGIVLQVYKHLGETVKKGDLLARLSSRELADAKARFVAADSLLQLAETTLRREKRLHDENITAKRKYLKALQNQKEMSIKRKAAKQQLQALGLSASDIAAVLQNTDQDLTQYELHAPADGVIIEQHAVYGEVLDTRSRSFTLADLSRVWVNLTVYQKDLNLLHPGQPVRIRHRFGLSTDGMSNNSTIAWISPTLDEKTRSAIARVILDNAHGHWRPGLFVNAQVAIAEYPADIVVPLTALQTIDGKDVIFIRHDDGDFEPRNVILGRRDSEQVEILSGLQTGQTYVSRNAFALKAQMQKGEFGSGHHH